MKKFPKAGLLIITLVIPALIFALLKLFGTNHYDLPYFVAEKDGNGSIIVQNGDTLFHQVSASCGLLRTVSLEGHFSVLYLMPADCDERCERAIDEFERVAALKENIRDLQPMVLPVDSAAVAGCVNKELSDPVKAADKPMSPAGLMVLIDSRKYVRGFYKAGDGEETDRLMAEIKILDYEKKNEK